MLYHSMPSLKLRKLETCTDSNYPVLKQLEAFARNNLHPTWWKIYYDQSRISMPMGVQLIVYASDLVVVVTVKTAKLQESTTETCQFSVMDEGKTLRRKVRAVDRKCLIECWQNSKRDGEGRRQNLNGQEGWQRTQQPELTRNMGSLFICWWVFPYLLPREAIRIVCVLLTERYSRAHIYFFFCERWTSQITRAEASLGALNRKLD